MAWVTISLRKLTLNARVNSLEYRLMKLSQDKQSQQSSAAYAQSQLNMQKNNAYMSVQNINSANVKNITDAMMAAQKNGQTDQATMQDFNNRIADSNSGMQMSKMMQDSLFQAQEDGMLQENNRKEAAIDQEIQMIETQLKAARAEEESLGKALDEDIKSSAIKLM